MCAFLLFVEVVFESAGRGVFVVEEGRVLRAARPDRLIGMRRVGELKGWKGVC